MGLILHENSWVTIAEADAYLADKFGASAWALSTEKAALLITAFREIYSSSLFSIPKTSTNEKVKMAQIEMGFWLLNYNDDKGKREALQIMGVTSAKADDTQENYNCKFIMPPFITDLLSGFMTGSTIAKFHRKVDHYI
jgi:hypothetical protein